MKNLILTLILTPFVFQAYGATPVVSDPLFSQQWSLNNDSTQVIYLDVDTNHTIAQKGKAGVDIGWLKALPDIQKRAKSPVTIAVIDSGIDPTQPELKGRISADGYDFLKKSAILVDDMGHGTHVSGIIAANTNDNAGMAGITPGTIQILPLRVLAAKYVNFMYGGRLVSDYVADAVRYAVAHHASIINLSLGWPKLVDTQNAKDAIQEAIQAGVLVVAASGNDRKDRPTYPCAYEGVLCVGAITNTGALTYFSNDGGLVDLLAPGDSIMSLFPLTMTSAIARIQGYEILSGTSQASPHIAAIAGIIKSALPDITLNELKARLLASTLKLDKEASALYGSATIGGALNAKPQAVFLPDFKDNDQIVVDESTLKASGQVSIKNLWQAAHAVDVQTFINNQLVGENKADVLNSGDSLTIPWTTQFQTLDDSSRFDLVLKVTDSEGDNKTFAVNLSGVRDVKTLQNQKVIRLDSALGWIAQKPGLEQLASMLTKVPNNINQEISFARLLRGTPMSIQIFSPNQDKPENQLRVLQIPQMHMVNEIFRMDIKPGTAPGWVVTGAITKDGKEYFAFYFVDANLQPLLGANSMWVYKIENPSVKNLIQRSYAQPSSWVNGDNGMKLPCFIANSQLPPKDNYDLLDPRHMQSENHFFYFSPLATQAIGENFELELRALDNQAFRDSNPDVHIVIPTIFSDKKDNVKHVLLEKTTGLSAPMSIWNIRTVKDLAIAPAAEWSVFKAVGISYHSISNDTMALSTFLPSGAAQLSWVDASGHFISESDFSFHDLKNPFVGNGLLGAFDFSKKDRVWFAETNYDLVAYHELNGQIKSKTLSIERDSSFGGPEFSEMFQPMLVGPKAHPQAAMFIDSTLVRGTLVSAAVWNRTNESFTRPLRYSLQLPPSCLQLNPTQTQDPQEVYTLPILCKMDDHLEFRLITP